MQFDAWTARAVLRRGRGGDVIISRVVAAPAVTTIAAEPF
jgi:hypothetical protein